MRKISIMILMAVILSLALSIGVSAENGDATMGDILAEATEYNGNYYLFVPKTCSWQEAKMYCEGLGGHLATITSQGEDEFCYQMWNNSGYNEGCWLGATDSKVEGVWEWITSEAWNYTHWGSVEPNGGTGSNYLDYYKLKSVYPNGEWNDSGNEVKNAFICEWEQEDIAYVKSTYGYITGSSVIYNNAFYFNGNIYKIFEYGMSSAEAEAYCQQLGGHLATITSKEEDQALYTYVFRIGNFNCVLGGSDEKTEGLWEWVTGEAFNYANWSEGEPNNQNGEDFIQYDGSKGKWNDTAWTNCFMCEWEDCCILSDGTVTEHSFGAGTTIVEATCTSLGKSEKTCLVCGTVVTTDMDMLPHAYSEWSTTTEATCYEAGRDERSCTLCEAVEARDIPQLTHAYSEYVVVSGNKLIPPIVKEKTCQLCRDVQREEDWSNIWITIVAAIAVVGVLMGVVNYIKAFKKKS